MFEKAVICALRHGAFDGNGNISRLKFRQFSHLFVLSNNRYVTRDFDVIFKAGVLGLDRLFKFEEFVLVRGEAKDWNEF